MIDSIEGFGLTDLCEILKKIHENTNISLENSRPQKLKLWLQVTNHFSDFTIKYYLK